MLKNPLLSRSSLKHVAAGGTLAEEVISTVRTAQAFGTQRVLADLYDGHTSLAYVADMKAAAWNGGGLAVFFFVIYSAYALGMCTPVLASALLTLFDLDSVLLWYDVDQPGSWYVLFYFNVSSMSSHT